MRSRVCFLSFFLFIFSSCNPNKKPSASFSNVTSLSDETVQFLPPAVDAEYIDGGVRLDAMIPGDASHMEINFNGTILKSCSAETLIPEGVATCPVGEESCEIQVKACNESTQECSDSLDINVFMNTESVLPSDVDSVMKAYELEQEKLQLARDLKIEACVAAKELEKYSETDVSQEALALRDGIEAICKTSDCDVVLGFDQFKSDLEGLIAQLAIQTVLEDEGDDTDDLDEEDTDELSEKEIALTAVSATLGVALLGGGGTGLYLWRKQARASGELLAKDLEIKELNEKILNISKQNEELGKNKAQANDADKVKISSLQELLKKEEEAVISLKRQRTYLVTAKKNLEEQLKNTNTDKLDLEKLRAELEAANNKNSELTKRIEDLEKIALEKTKLDKKIEELELKQTEANEVATNLKRRNVILSFLIKNRIDSDKKNKKNKKKIAELEAQVASNKTKIAELETTIQEKDTLLADSKKQNEDLTAKLEAQTAELNRIKPELTTALEDNKRLEEELKAFKEVQELLKKEKLTNQSNTDKITELEERLAAAKRPEQQAAEAKKLAEQQAEITRKAEQINELKDKLLDADKKRFLSRFIIMMQRKIHQEKMDELLKNWKEQVDAMVQGFDQQDAKKNNETEELKNELNKLKIENEKLIEALREKDERLKAGQEKTQTLKDKITALQSQKNPANNEEIKKLNAEISRLKNGEVYRENIKLKEIMEFYARRVSTTLEFLLKGSSSTQDRNKDLMKHLANVIKYANNNGILDVNNQSNNMRNYLNKVQDIKIHPLTSESTDDFMERVSQFFSNVAARQAKAYQNNLELEELRVNFF